MSVPIAATAFIALLVLAGCTAPAVAPAQPEGTPAVALPGLAPLYLRLDGGPHMAHEPGPQSRQPILLSPARADASIRFAAAGIDAPAFSTGMAHLQVRLEAGSVGGDGIAVLATLTMGDFTSSAQAHGLRPSFALEVPPRMEAGETIELQLDFEPRGIAWDGALIVDEKSRLETPAPVPGAFTQGPVHVEAQADGWIARRVDALRTDTGLAGAIIGLTTVNGAVHGQVREPAGGGDPDEDEGLQVRAHLWARGEDEEAARQRLADLRTTVELNEGPPLRLIARVTPDGQGPRAWEGRGGDIVLTASDGGPSDADLRAERIGHGAADVALASTNGEITWHHDALGLDARTTNGDILASFAGRGGAFTTTNGEVSLTFLPLASGTLHLSSTNGDVGLSLQAFEGLDLEGSTTNGQVRFDLRGVEPQGAQSDRHRHVRTTGFDEAQVQTTVRAIGTNGDVSAGKG